MSPPSKEAHGRPEMEVVLRNVSEMAGPPDSMVTRLRPAARTTRAVMTQTTKSVIKQLKGIKG
jgi:hypothetical protein